MNGSHYILKYLKGTPSQGVIFSASSSLNISAYSDADWRSCSTTQKSTTWFYIFISGSLVALRSKKQAIVSRSSAKAEYRVLASATSELLWLKQLLRAFNIEVSYEPWKRKTHWHWLQFHLKTCFYNFHQIDPHAIKIPVGRSTH